MDVIQIFEHSEFGKIRVVEIEGKPRFVGKDVAEALGYSNVSKALVDHANEDDRIMIDSETQSRLGIYLGQRGGWVINEDGLYSLIYTCKLPAAKPFKSWIQSDVLPMLQQHNNPVKNDEITSEPLVNTFNTDEKCAIQIFENPEFGQIRMLEEGEKVLFCGKDVAAALGYSNTKEAIIRHCPGVVKRDLGVQTGTKADGSPAFQQVEMSFIPEGDVYRLLAHSQLPTAVKFERWVFDEVLPSIRKHGLYAIDELAKNPKLLLSVLQEYIQEQEQRQALEIGQTQQSYRAI